MRKIDISTKTHPAVFTLVDDADFDWLNQYNWCMHRDHNVQYALTNTPRDRHGKQKTIRMHRLIMGLGHKDGLMIDHINRDGLDNRRCNLRMCTFSQNGMNKRTTTGSSKYKGVCWHKRDKSWTACIRLRKELIYLGYHDSEIDAAKTYDNKAIELFGEFANLNFPEVPCA